MATPPDPFDEALGAAQHSAVHLEMRDTYGVTTEAESYAAWKTTGRRDVGAEAARRQPWFDLVKEAVGRGVAVRRARIVSEPVTDYIRFEHAGTPPNIEAGEQIRWLPRRLASDIALPGNDFWLFDGRLVRFGIFSGDGAFVESVYVDHDAVANMCAAAFEAVWERATPHEDYQLI